MFQTSANLFKMMVPGNLHIFENQNKPKAYKYSIIKNFLNLQIHIYINLQKELQQLNINTWEIFSKRY